MAGVTDFLFQGVAPPSVTSYGSSTANLPQWLSDYSQGLVSRANAVAGTDYPAYPGPRVAPVSDDTQAAWDTARSNVGSWQPAFGAASGTLGAANTMLNTASGYTPAAFGTPYIASANADVGQSLSFDPQAAAAGSVAGATGAIGSAMGDTAGYLGQGTDLVNTAQGQSAAGAGSPYLTAAAKTLPGQIGDYMNPYNDQVVNRIGDLAARQLNEKLIPAVGDDFTRAGQYGSSRMQEAVGHALRDTDESALAAQGQLLQQGYGLAGQQYQTDAGRLATIGNTAGTLMGTDAAHSLTGAQTMGQFGNIQGNVDLGTGQAYTSLGALQDKLAMDRSSQYITAANAEGNLGQVAGNQAYQTMQGLTGIGAQQGALAQAYMGLGRGTQASGTADAAGLEAAGQSQQAQTQRNYDTGYQDFQNQSQWPFQMVNFMNGAIRGVPYSTSATTTNTGPLPGAQYAASPLNQLAGGLTLASSLFKKDGGRVGYRDGGRVKPSSAYRTASPYRRAA